MSQLDEKWPSYAKFNVLVPKWHLANFVPIDGHFGQIVRYGLQICFASINIGHFLSNFSILFSKCLLFKDKSNGDNN